MQRNVPIVLMSGDSSEAEAVRRATGLTDIFLSKPFTLPDLQVAVQRLLSSQTSS
jgi:CheY-like chemotaxis protein